MPAYSLLYSPPNLTVELRPEENAPLPDQRTMSSDLRGFGNVL